MDAVTRDIQKAPPWNLPYANDRCLAALTRQGWKTAFADGNLAAEICLRLNVKTTEYMESGLQTDSSAIIDEPLRRAVEFRHLKSYVASEEGSQRDVSERLNMARSEWWKFSGVQCGAKIPRRLKSKIHRTIVCPNVMYGFNSGR